MQAASLLVSPKQSAGLQDQLRQLVSLDTLTYAKDKDRSTGYKAIEPGLRSTTQSTKQNSGVSQSMLLLGKYLTPQLYVSYGRSLFDESQQIRARYSFSRQWEVETRVSSDASGGDLFYRIEFE
jgi:translocation and assembly module TamB